MRLSVVPLGGFTSANVVEISSNPQDLNYFSYQWRLERRPTRQPPSKWTSTAVSSMRKQVSSRNVPFHPQANTQSSPPGADDPSQRRHPSRNRSCQSYSPMPIHHLPTIRSSQGCLNLSTCIRPAHILHSTLDSDSICNTTLIELSAY